jgi:hypothetical protein
VVEAPEVVGFAAQAGATVLLNAMLSIRDFNKFGEFVFLQIRIRNYYEANFEKKLSCLPYGSVLTIPNIPLVSELWICTSMFLDHLDPYPSLLYGSGSGSGSGSFHHEAI